MSEQFTRLFELPHNLYRSGAPVIILTGVLLKDNGTGRVRVQLKFENISTKTIKALTVELQPLDAAGTPLAGKSRFCYSDISAARDDVFGEETLIPFLNDEIRTFSVKVTETAFADNSVWKDDGTDTWNSIDFSVLLKDELGRTEWVRQYQKRFGTNCKYAFRQVKNSNFPHQ